VQPGDTGALATFYSADALSAESPTVLGADAAKHVRALRLQPGAAVRLTDGRGAVAIATLGRVGKDLVNFDLREVRQLPRGGEVHALVPVADKERMLWLAEKAIEIGITSWRPVVWNRSRSVASRGEGPHFRRRLLSRMTAALEQSGNAWLPDVFPESRLDRSIAAAPEGMRLLLHPHAAMPFPFGIPGAAVIVVGPEGGLDEEEVSMLTAASFVPVRMEAHMLRFETAGVVALALARAAQDRSKAQNHSDGGISDE
jgi:16S rRNA (uracil1498-N3)-methyltransferase